MIDFATPGTAPADRRTPRLPFAELPAQTSGRRGRPRPAPRQGGHADRDGRDRTRRDGSQIAKEA